MKKSHIFIVLGVLLLLFPPTSWASDQLNASEDTPAILASLNQSDVTPLDDAALTDIRGQAAFPFFRMVRLFLLNYWDRKGSGDWEFTGNLFQWAYGNFGGINQIGGDGSGPVDGADYLYYLHDEGILTNAGLAAQLDGLPRPNPYGVWGPVYMPGSPGLSDIPVAQIQGDFPDGYSPFNDHFDWTVKVCRLSVLSYGGGFFWGSKLMPLTEYARRQAYIAMSVLSLLP